jgi:hypothetical protein
MTLFGRLNPIVQKAERNTYDIIWDCITWSFAASCETLVNQKQYPHGARLENAVEHNNTMLVASDIPRRYIEINVKIAVFRIS